MAATSWFLGLMGNGSNKSSKPQQQTTIQPSSEMSWEERALRARQAREQVELDRACQVQAGYLGRDLTAQERRALATKLGLMGQ